MQCLTSTTLQKGHKDIKLANGTPLRSTITAYGGTHFQLWARCFYVSDGEISDAKYNCKLVDNSNIHPLLGRKACLGMKIVSYLDNDELYKSNVGDSTVSEDIPVSKEVLAKKYPKVFNMGVGKLEGEYHIRLDPKMNPVKHAPRRVPVALRAPLTNTLEDMVRQDIIAPVTKPTSWISSMVVVPKKNGDLRICLDPKDLNKAIQLEPPTIEDVATRLYGAKLFTILDVRIGFWHVVLDESSSFLTTFHTPFGRYRWKRMPFGICSAPEVFQRRMHELIEGLHGIEVITDDFAAVGFGKTPLLKHQGITTRTLKHSYVNAKTGELDQIWTRCNSENRKLPLLDMWPHQGV